MQLAVFTARACPTLAILRPRFVLSAETEPYSTVVLLFIYQTQYIEINSRAT